MGVGWLYGCIVIYLYYNGMHTTAAVFSIHSAPPCCSTVCYSTLYRHIESKAPTCTLSKQMWSIYLYYNGMHTTAAVFSIQSAPPCCTAVCYSTLYRHIESKALTCTLSKQMWSVIKVSQYLTRGCLESKVRIVATPHYTDIYASKPIRMVASAHYVDI